MPLQTISQSSANPIRPIAEQPMRRESIREEIASLLMENFGVEPKGRACVYQKPYPNYYYDTISYPRGFMFSDFVKFNGEDSRTTIEHIGQFLAQYGEASSNDACHLRLFLLSLSGNAFTWFISLAPNSIYT